MESVCSAQVRAICVQIAYHSKLEVSSLSGDFKNAHRSPAKKSWLLNYERGGSGEPFAQGWTHTNRRRRRFFKKRWPGVVVVSFLDIEPH